MKRILCPTDFSDTANNAIAYSGKLAKKIGASLTLFNVQSLANLTLDEAVMGEASNEGAAAARLEQQCAEVQKVFKVSCYAEVATSVASVINLIGSKSDGYDLIVMGSNGPDDLRQILLGSNTYQVIKKSSIPLLLIPDGCGYSEVGTTVYAFDYWSTDQLPLAQLVRFTKALGSNLRVLQVMEESYSRKAEEEILAMQEMILDLYKDDIAISFDTIYAADIADSVDNYVVQNSTDMLALSTGRPGFLKKLFHKSVIRELSAKVSYPLYIFHAP